MSKMISKMDIIIIIFKISLCNDITKGIHV